MKEVQEFHPLVASWLDDRGYTYEHEYMLPDYGKVDFYAVSANGKETLIECKVKKSDIKKGIVQAATYRVQLPECNTVIAIPTGLMNESLRLMAEKYEVGILEIDTVSHKELPIEYNSFYELNERVTTSDEWEEIVIHIFSHPDKELAMKAVKSLFMISLGSVNLAYKDELLKVCVKHSK